MSSFGKQISSSRVRAGCRTYFLDLKEYDGLGVCLVIIESKRISDGAFERCRIVVDSEYVPRLFQSLRKLLEENNLLGQSGRSADRGESLRLSNTKSGKANFSTRRVDYPNAYLPWASADDELLKEAFQKCRELTLLADTFMRTPSAIRSRLQKLGLIT